MRTPVGVQSTERVERVWVDTHERLWRAVYAWSADREIASDAVNEAFAQALRRGDAVEDVARWVWRTAFRIAAGLLADRRRSPAELLIDPVGSDSLPDDVIALVDALQRLSEGDRELVVLALVGGWSAREIARVTDTTAGAVRVRLHRARRELRALLEVSDG